MLGLGRRSEEGTACPAPLYNVWNTVHSDGGAGGRTACKQGLRGGSNRRPMTSEDERAQYVPPGEKNFSHSDSSKHWLKKEPYESTLFQAKQSH